MDRFVCIHGHFYQPPRENAWLEAIELQDSAFPYHDWNERVTSESYAPNAGSRILDGDNRIVKIANNYNKISFNFGPTLFAWMEAKAPAAYQAILKADKESQERFAGHGNAMAQAYNHIIMPLANSRDKGTQLRWGIHDFQHRFGRLPEGLWLPETAVDMESLDMMAELGILFVILEPGQASRTRPLEGGEWSDVSGGRIDPTRPYLQRLPSGRSIAIFFYDAPVSRAVAFEGLLSKGEYLAQRIMGTFSGERQWAQMVHIATDGETYGHHHRFGDMALAYALEVIDQTPGVRLTNYGEFLALNPPSEEVEIIENTSWSCAHGLERWKGDCGCNTGGHEGWHQGWRGPLRAALDWLRDRLANRYEDHAGTLLKDPWAARDDYIRVVLDRSEASVHAFLSEHAIHLLSPSEQVLVLKLLEMQRHTMLMYTSCGWFFDDLSGIETVQIIAYAARALQLAAEVTGDTGSEAGFLSRLELAKSNIALHQNGRVIYEKSVRPAEVDIRGAGTHYAVSSIFENYPEDVDIYCYRFEQERQCKLRSGPAGLVIGRVLVRSNITGEAQLLSYGALHFGEHLISGVVKDFVTEEAFELFQTEAGEAFNRSDFPGTLRTMARHFGGGLFSLGSLFRDKQREILDRILESTLADAESDYRRLNDLNFSLIRLLVGLSGPLPQGYRAAARPVLTTGLRKALREGNLDPTRVKRLWEEAGGLNLLPDDSGLGLLFRDALEQMMEGLAFNPNNLELLQKLEAAVVVAKSMPFGVSFRNTKNTHYSVLQNAYPRMRDRAERGDGMAQQWIEHFLGLAEQLAARVA